MEGSKERNKDRQERILIKVKSIADSNPSTLWANLTATDLIDDPPPTDRDKGIIPGQLSVSGNSLQLGFPQCVPLNSKSFFPRPYQLMPPTNVHLLTQSHSLIKAKKDAKKRQIEEIVFDEDAR